MLGRAGLDQNWDAGQIFVRREAEPRWDREHLRYMCVDGMEISARRELENAESTENGIRYKVSTLFPSPQFALLISGLGVSRDVVDLVSAPRAIKTFTTPQTIRTIRKSTLSEVPPLMSVVLSEGLETLQENVFRYSSLRRIVLPATL